MLCSSEMISQNCQRKAGKLEENPKKATSAHLFSNFVTALAHLNEDYLTHFGWAVGCRFFGCFHKKFWQFSRKNFSLFQFGRKVSLMHTEVGNSCMKKAFIRAFHELKRRWLISTSTCIIYTFSLILWSFSVAGGNKKFRANKKSKFNFCARMITIHGNQIKLQICGMVELCYRT